MEKVLLNRVGQCIMTSPTSACYDGLRADAKVKTGGKLRFFGDGFQSSKLLEKRRLWRVPVMDGEFVIEESFSMQKAIGGGNFLILAENERAALSAAEASVEEMCAVPGIIMPFPGGVVRSGSKVGSRYKGQFVSTNTAYCPTIRRQTASALPEGVNCVMEIVIDGLDEGAVREGMRVGSRPPAVLEWCASRPEITAASWAAITSIWMKFFKKVRSREGANLGLRIVCRIDEAIRRRKGYGHSAVKGSQPRSLSRPTVSARTSLSAAPWRRSRLCPRFTAAAR